MKYCTCTVLPEPIVYEVEPNWVQDQYSLLERLIEQFNEKSVDVFEPECDSSTKIPADKDWLAEYVFSSLPRFVFRI
jgi:hypothetical protein